MGDWSLAMASLLYVTVPLDVELTVKKTIIALRQNSSSSIHRRYVVHLVV